ncbi:sce7725 family protein, partial [Enterococcus entomosocium]
AGFSDFSVDSKIYYEHSYPSKRLVLHWIYPTTEQDLRIVHLFSEEELPNQKEKFFEVMEALLQHEEEYPTQTAGLQLLIAAYQQRSFPGMGVIRKAAVMNHLELVSRLI